MKSGRTMLRFWLLFHLCYAVGCSLNAKKGNWPQYMENPFVIALGIPIPTDDRGSVTVADLDRDDLMDYLVTRRGCPMCAVNPDGSNCLSRCGAAALVRFGDAGRYSCGESSRCGVSGGTESQPDGQQVL